MAEKPGRKKRVRDYKAEYQRRLERMVEYGVSRAVARGHAKEGEMGMREFQTVGRQLRSEDVAVRRQGLERIGQAISINSAEDLAQALSVFGFTRHQAYTLWHSPDAVDLG